MNIYNLEEIYEKINREYFQNKINLSIHWFGNPDRKNKTSRILGYYDRENKRIKIHRALDHPFFPDYFLSFLIYHEMLHDVCPPKRGRRGMVLMHHAEFKKERGISSILLWLKDGKKRIGKIF